MNVGQPVIMPAANSEAQEPTEDVMDDADVAGLDRIILLLFTMVTRIFLPFVRMGTFSDNKFLSASRYGR